MSDPRSPLVKPQRIDVVDWLRGVAVFLMILAHGMDAWLLPSAKSGAVYAVIRVASGIPARLFLLLVGISAAIQFESGLAKNVDGAVMRARLLRRSFQVLLLAYLFRLQEWLLSRFYGGLESLLRVDILNAIALSMMVVALVATPRRGRRQIVPALALAALFLALGSTVGPAHFPDWLPRPLTSYIGGQRPMAWFPLFPWGAWALTGVAIGHAWVLASRSKTSLTRAFTLTFVTGAILVITVLVIRAIDPTIVRYPSELVMQMGPGIFFHRLGLNGLLAGTGFLWCQLLRNRFSVMRQLGRTSLLVYWVHIEFCYGSFVYSLRGRFHVAGAAVGVAILTAAMLGLSLAKTHYGPPAVDWLRARFRSARPA